MTNASGIPCVPPRLSVAPMMDWTDSPCRVFHRLLSPHARLYTEMVHANAVVRGDRARLLAKDAVEHPWPCSWAERTRSNCARRADR